MFTRNKIKDKTSDLVFIKDYGGDIDKGLYVIFHGTLGSFNRFNYLADALIACKGSKVIGLGIKEINEFCSMPPSDLIYILSDIYSQKILRYKAENVRLIGYCFGGVLALETANRLNEKSMMVRSISIIDSLLLPHSFRVEDKLLMEMMFLDNITVSYDDIGMPYPDLYEHVLVQESMKKDVIGSGFLENLSGRAEMEQLGEFFKDLAMKTQEERFGLYAEQVKKKNNIDMPLELITSLYNVCVVTFNSMHYEMSPYLGNINYYFAVNGEVEFKKMLLSTWEKLALGTFSVIEIPGNHYSCVEQKENAEYLAELLCDLKS